MKAFRLQFSTGYRNAKSDLDVSPSQTAIIVSILSAGTFVGALLAAPLGDKLGRKMSLIIAVGIFSIGTVLQTIALQIPMLVVGR